MKIFKLLSLLFISTLILTSCSNDDDGDPINEVELITTLIATLTPPTGTAIVLTFRDLDGDGPGVPTITVSGALAENTTYTGTLILLNETESPAENITEEIEEEADEHQFFFQTGGGLAISNFTYLDFDSDGNPLGLNFSFTTGTAPSSGTFTITLRHEPNKNAAGVSQGNIANAGGETDIQVTFPITIE